MDAIDPYPFLNQVCGARRLAEPPPGTAEPLER
jgi:hypothetical protein